MEYVKCPFCGKETLVAFSKCRHCGQKLPTREEIAEKTVIRQKKRAGFTTFWLWLGVVVNSLLTIAYFATIFTQKGLWSAYDPMSSRIYGFVTSGVLVLGYLALIKWKRFGFFILIFMGVLSLMMNMFDGGQVSFATFSPITSLLVLYVVLQIKKNGKSCWEQLD
ncbi:MAG: hypothetical protein ACI4AH_00810 [Muribaculaceae bacterium]